MNNDIVERLNAVRESLEAGCDDWPIASHIWEYKTAASTIESLRRQLAEKDAEIGRLKEELTTAAIDIKKAIDESRKVLVADWTEKFSLQQQQLAARQAREVHLLKALNDIAINSVDDSSERTAREAIALPQDVSALEAMIAKAGDVMRKRCEAMLRYQGGANIDLVRALPGATLEDLND